MNPDKKRALWRSIIDAIIAVISAVGGYLVGS